MNKQTVEKLRQEELRYRGHEESLKSVMRDIQNLVQEHKPNSVQNFEEDLLQFLINNR